MASVHGVSCTFVNGEVPALKMRTATWAIPGVNGVGSVWLGYGDAKFRIQAILYDDYSDLCTWTAAIQALQGTIGTIVTSLGTYTYCLITGISVPVVTPAYPYGYRGEIVLEGERVG